MIYIILAFITGGLVILSMILNSGLAKRIGVFQGTFINFIVGLSFISLALLTTNNSMDFSFNNLSTVPFWAYLGGAIGVLVVATTNTIIPKIPTIYSTLLIFIGQLLAASIIDYFTGHLVSKWKIIGGLFIVSGLLYNSYIDKSQKDQNQLLDLP
ncbi:DMT family transporter [Clostridium sp. D2Q-11]|uniref:DMT family transporter n=1 Tax=Anaeromonas frigoriresistens TaxID=2683708 RepID=A0A942Z7M3_9FIRM|nr:DMT family transporter [Anaeromonas frigoriresistens]MBS4538852.1 DMT family transporter [Anaeromonas frigoriresistens]